MKYTNKQREDAAVEAVPNGSNLNGGSITAR